MTAENVARLHGMNCRHSLIKQPTRFLVLGPRIAPELCTPVFAAKAPENIRHFPRDGFTLVFGPLRGTLAQEI